MARSRSRGTASASRSPGHSATGRTPTSISPKAAKRVTEAEGTWAPIEFSADGRRLLVLHERSIQDADLFALDVASGTLTQLTPKEGKASVVEARFTGDGKGVYVVTDRWSD